jgi:hypothetical protein
MAKREDTLEDVFIRELMKTGVITRKPFIIKIRLKTGKCKIKGCKGTVGKLWGICINSIIAPDYSLTLMAWPCDKCGALHNLPNAEHLVRDKKGNPIIGKVFAHDIELRTRDKGGKTIYFRKVSQRIE